MKDKIYVLIFDHDWGARYPRRKSSFYFLTKPSKAAIEELIGVYGWENKKEYYEVKEIILGERYI